MNRLHRLIFGRQGFRSEDEYNKIQLAGYFLLMYIGIDVFFLIVNLFNPNANNLPIFTGMLITGGCLVLLNRGFRDLAILIQLIRANYIAWLFTYYDTNLTGNFMYFIVSGIGALALYGYSERWKGVSLATISLFLFYTSILKPEEFKPSSPHFFLLMNFTIGYIMAFFIIYFLNQLTYQTQRKIQEKNIQLQKVNDELDRFVYSVSHDLRAPLSSISGLIQLSEKATTMKENAEYLDLMKDRVDRLETFIRDIIHFSRNARTRVELSPIELRSMVDEIIESLRHSINAEAITMRNHVDREAVIQSDPSRLKIVLTNLISNAIQYHDPRKESPRIDIMHQPKTAHHEITIADNGLGIDPTHHHRVYDMFFRAHQNSQGSGLGLYIVKETLDRLQGSIHFKSELGSGTQFTISIPVAGHSEWSVAT